MQWIVHIVTNWLWYQHVENLAVCSFAVRCLIRSAALIFLFARLLTTELMGNKFMSKNSMHRFHTVSIHCALILPNRQFLLCMMPTICALVCSKTLAPRACVYVCVCVFPSISETRANTGHAVLQSTSKPLKMRRHNETTDRRMDGWTDGQTDQRTDTPSYRDARTHLKIWYKYNNNPVFIFP